MMPPARLTATASSRRLLILGFVRSYFRQHGASPSFAEIAAGCGVSKQRVGRYIAALERQGVLHVSGRLSRSIVLVDQAANLSDDELEFAARVRGWTVKRSAMPALGDAYPVEPGLTEMELHLLSALDHTASVADGERADGDQEQ